MIRFSKDYSKLKNPVFTTIRKNTSHYRIGSVHAIKTPSNSFVAKITDSIPLRKTNITEDLAESDADCSREELIGMLEKWYGKEFNDFVLLTLAKAKEELMKTPKIDAILVADKYLSASQRRRLKAQWEKRYE